MTGFDSQQRIGSLESCMTKRLSTKAGRNPDPPLSDRERILITIIQNLYLNRDTPSDTWSSEPYRYKNGNGYRTHFAPWKKPEPGDLVMAFTGMVSRWKIGWYVKKMDDDEGAVIREIGSQSLCNYSNEIFYPIRGLRTTELLEQDEYKFYIKVLKAFQFGDEYVYRFNDIKFESGIAIITIRERFGGVDGESVPFDIRIPWTKSMSINSILTTMEEQGYGYRSFSSRGPYGWGIP